MADRSNRPRSCPSAAPPALASRVRQLRARRRMNREAIARATGVSAGTAGRIIARAGLPHLADPDAITGQPVRAGSMSRVRYI